MKDEMEDISPRLLYIQYKKIHRTHIERDIYRASICYYKGDSYIFFSCFRGALDGISCLLFISLYYYSFVHFNTLHTPCLHRICSVYPLNPHTHTHTAGLTWIYPSRGDDLVHYIDVKPRENKEEKKKKKKILDIGRNCCEVSGGIKYIVY
jgi:hypothetical protein